MAEKFATVEEYLDSLSPESRTALEQVRERIRATVPDAEEVISYNIPTFRQGGRRLVHVAGWKAHVGLYPLPAGDVSFEEALAPYVSGKGTVKFPLAQPIPLDLVQRIVEALLDERSPAG